MVRQRRLYYRDAVYHVTFRGNNRQMILKDDQDKETFLMTLAKFKRRFQFKVYGLCLMDNHAHLVLESSQGYNISRIMQSILLSYSLTFRRKYNYVGHVFQGRFNSNVIQGEMYLQECLEYIHNNPVKANMVETPGNYVWSSYQFYNNLSNEIMDGKNVLDRFGDTSDISL